MSALGNVSRGAMFVCAAILLLAGALLGCGGNKGIASVENELTGVSYVRQIVSKDNTNSRMIMWQTKNELPDPAVEYHVVGSEDLHRVNALAENFTDDGVSVVLYSAELTELPTGSELEYRLASGSEVGAWHALKTDDGGSFTALIFPDSQSGYGDYSDWAELAKSAYARNPEAKFFINMGDLVDNGEDHSQWEAWFESVGPFSDRIPLAPLMGNHETYNLDWKVREPVAYLRAFNVPANGNAEMDRFYYSYDYGTVHFIVLNTQQGELADFNPTLLEAQLKWFREDIASTDKPWKVVLMHKDPLQYRIHNRPERTEGFSEEGEIWMPLFDELGVDVVLSAHLHTYRNRGHIRNFEHDPSGPLYILTGVAGTVRYPGLWIDHALDEYVAPQPETDNYMTMQATAEQLDFYSFLPDGTQLDHAVVRH